MSQSYLREFAKIKPKILKRDIYTCQLQDKPEFGRPWGCYGPLSVDHIHRRSTGGGNEKENLITLCWGHHGYVEDMIQADKSNLLHAILKEKYFYGY